MVYRDRLGDLIKIETHILGCWYVCEREMMCVFGRGIESVCALYDFILFSPTCLLSTSITNISVCVIFPYSATVLPVNSIAQDSYHGANMISPFSVCVRIRWRVCECVHHRGVSEMSIGL